MRKRKAEDAWMPPRVYRNKVRGQYVSFIYKQAGSTKTITLCGINSSRAEVWVAYESAIGELNAVYTMRSLINEYLTSTHFIELAPRTQKDREQELERFGKVFGKMRPDAIEPHHIRTYMDKRGVSSKTQANHELASASVVFAWGYERGRCKSNPAKGIKKFKLKARERYITDTEYQAICDCAELRLRLAIEISYLCAARQGDVIDLKWSQVTEEGLFIQQGKTGKRQIKGWSNRLRNIIDEAKSLQSCVASIYVINKDRGGKLSSEGIRSSWRRAINKMKEQYPHLATDFTFHDLKAKGISDFEGTLAEKQQFSGHKTLAQVNTYDRRVPVVPTLGGNKGE
ncbi:MULTISPECIES: tyrosine-type recombinase/integrase [Shewanella]|uniref:Tyrosine-type recombinase/integrase n=1 Tax=Shewanella mangrovisoli TaxID=2864211 RepID=A0ABV4VH36_9GAMM